MLKAPIIKSLFIFMLPVACSAGIQHINLLIDVYLATSIHDEVPGAVPALTYAQRLIQFPIGIFSIAINMATIPVLSRQFVKKKRADFIQSLFFSIRLTIFFMLPASLGFIMFSEEIVYSIFEWGQFNRESTLITGTALKYYAIGIVAYGIQNLLNLAFYARRATRQPVLVAVFISASNVAPESDIDTIPSTWRHCFGFFNRRLSGSFASYFGE